MISSMKVCGFTLQLHIVVPAQSSSHSISCRLADIQEMNIFSEEYPTQNQVFLCENTGHHTPGCQSIYLYIITGCLEELCVYMYEQ